MMTLLNRRNFVVVLIALALTFLGASSTHAQNEGQATQAQSESRDTGLISVDFPGGTITEYVNALAKAAGSVNVLISPEAADFSMPAVKLTKVSVSAAISLVSGKRRDKNDIEAHLLADYINVKRKDVNEQATYKIEAIFPSKRKPTVEETHSRVWSIAHLIQDGVFNSKVVLAALEMAIDVTKSTTKVDIRFHEATGLLIASGSQDQLVAIENVLDELARSSQMKTFQSNKKLEDELSRVNFELRRTSVEVLDLTGKLASVDNKNKALRLELETQMARFVATTRMLNEREGMLRDTTSKLRELRDVLDRAQRRTADDDKSGNKDN